MVTGVHGFLNEQASTVDMYHYMFNLFGMVEHENMTILYDLDRLAQPSRAAPSWLNQFRPELTASNEAVASMLANVSRS